MSEKYRVFVTDGVSSKGVEIFTQVPEIEVVESKSLPEEELINTIQDFDGLVVRSATKVTRAVIEGCPKLKVVGRAGVGVDNVDLKAATEKGVVVMNTPGGNTVSTAEHAFSLMMSISRNIPQAHSTMKDGGWDRKKFQGVELNNKVLGIIGMGRIGSEVARRAIAFGMRVLAYDPYLTTAKARSLQVELFENLSDMLPECDYITLHIPMTPETKGILNKESMAKCKDGVRLINCARGGLIDEVDLKEFLDSGKVAAAALDVYVEEPPPVDFALRTCENIVLTPHLGASTKEAQVSVGIEVAESIRDYLLSGTVRNAVNVPNVDSKTLESVRPYIHLAEKLGQILAQLSNDRNETFSIHYAGKIKDLDTSSVTRASLKGFLRQAIGPDVNEINVTHYAENLGIDFTSSRVSESGDYSELITVTTKSSDGKLYEVSGTLFGQSDRIVRIDDHWVEAKPEGVLLAMENTDRPGIIGIIGSLLAKHQINIANMSLSRTEPGSKALSLLNLDSMPNETVVAELLAEEGISSIKLIQL
ncbi:MAG: phosphoglycerate dehydrogenase [Verrucomicrobiota bacterium]